ncbi:MAG TPA: PEP-CTERM sorting domain-containing protein [Edaphobacter sp.]|nr:PEP-CTERM sorting domain-containing protein [Edaphobacter sp.]
MRLGRFVAVLAILSVSLIARADAIYTYTAPGLGTFTWEEPSILTSLTAINAVDLISSTDPRLNYISFDPTGSGGPGSGCYPGTGLASCIDLWYIDGSGAGRGYYVGPLTSPGSYSLGTFDSLTITQTAAETPEPSSFALLGIGLLGAVGVIRSKSFNA